MNCIYARPGYCVVRRDMKCHEDCSYYLDKEDADDLEFKSPAALVYETKRTAE